MSHGILVIKITRWIGIGWREGYQPSLLGRYLTWVMPPLCQMKPKYSQGTAPTVFSPDFTRFWIFFLLFLFFQKIQYTISIYCIRCRSGQIFSSLCFEVTHMYRQSIYVYLHYRGVTFSQTNSPPQQLDSPWEHQATILHMSWFVHGRSEVVHTDSPTIHLDNPYVIADNLLLLAHDLLVVLS